MIVDTKNPGASGALSRRVAKTARQTVWCLAAASLVLLASCGSQQTDELPTLHVADQLNWVQSALAASGEDKPTDYRISWSNFFSGPPIIAAETGGSVDLGWMAETPLVFAQAAGSPVKVVGVSVGTRPGAANIGLAVDAGSPIRSVADLRGKRVGYMSGTVAQFLVVKVLRDSKLSLGDVKPVQLGGFNPAILRKGVVDAVVTTEPFLSQGLHDGTLRVLAYGGEPNTPGYTYLVASDAALADPKRAALIGEFVARVARASRWVRENPAKAAPYSAKAFNVTPAIAEQIVQRNPRKYVPIDAAIIARQQQEADFFHELGLIPARVDAAKLFDGRYAKQIAAVETAP